MPIPFTIAEFLAVFRAYNEAVWPAPVVLYLLGAALILAAHRSATGRAKWVVLGGLSALWLWMGAVYHLAFFTTINPAATLFGAGFIVQSVLWLVWGWRAPTLAFQPSAYGRRILGWVILFYAFLLYPLLNQLLGHAYPTMPTFGAPCPTTIATFGLLVWASPRPPWYILIVPLLWAIVGTSAAFSFGIWEDLGLPAAAVLLLMSVRFHR